MPQIQRVWQANMQVYGADKVWRQLAREGVTVAQQIDADFLASTRIESPTLDDMPYGEELIRVRDLPAQVKKAVAHLESVSDGNVSAALAYERFQTVLISTQT